MAFEIPLYSQFLDVSLKDWRDRSCGIVALKMLMEFLGAETPNADTLIKEGIEAGAYIPNVGWKHQGLVDLAVQHGLRGERFDWSGRTPGEALRNLKKLLASGPVLCSIHRDFDPERGGHLIVVTGMENRSVSYADPAAERRDEISASVPVQMFMDGWKCRGIVIVKGE